MDTKSRMSPPKTAEQAEAWTQLFNAYPFPVLWCTSDGKLFRVNPLGQKILGEKVQGHLMDLGDEATKALLQNKLRLVLTDGHCEFAAPLCTQSNVTLNARWFMQLLGSMEDTVVQVLVVCEPPAYADKELRCHSGLLGSLAEQRGEELSRLRQDYHLEMIQRRKTTTELGRASEKLDEAQAEIEAKDQHLLQNDKMLSLGQMAAGVTHEINNPLTYLSCNLYTLGHYLSGMRSVLKAYQGLAEGLESSGEWQEKLSAVRELEKQEQIARVVSDVEQLLEDCLKGTQRVEEIASQIQNFARKDDSRWVNINLNHVLEDALRVSAHEFGARCMVEKQLGRLPKVYCHPGQLCQVFVNLLVNAAQSIVESGKLLVKTQAIPGFVELKVTDTGQGMAPELCEQIFTPFFTTKAKGKGTGLGLFVSRQIIENHEGSISVETEEGKGTTFTICLPISMDQDD